MKHNRQQQLVQQVVQPTGMPALVLVKSGLINRSLHIVMYVEKLLNCWNTLTDNAEGNQQPDQFIFKLTMVQRLRLYKRL